MVPAARSDGIVKWVKRKTGPFAATIASADQLASMEKDAAVVVLGFFSAFEVRLSMCSSMEMRSAMCRKEVQTADGCVCRVKTTRRSSLLE